MWALGSCRVVPEELEALKDFSEQPANPKEK